MKPKEIRIIKSNATNPYQAWLEMSTELICSVPDCQEFLGTVYDFLTEEKVFFDNEENFKIFCEGARGGMSYILKMLESNKLKFFKTEK